MTDIRTVVVEREVQAVRTPAMMTGSASGNSTIWRD